MDMMSTTPLLRAGRGRQNTQAMKARTWIKLIVVIVAVVTYIGHTANKKGYDAGFKDATDLALKAQAPKTENP